MRALVAVLLSTAAICAPCSAHAAGTPPPVADFSRYDEHGTIKISPDGEFLAIGTGQGGTESLVFVDIQEKKAPLGIKARSGTRIIHFEWASPNRLIYHMAEFDAGRSYAGYKGEMMAIDRDGKWHQFIYGFRAGEKTTGTRLPQKQASFAHAEIISYLKSDAQHVLITEQPWRLAGNAWRLNPDAAPGITRLNIYDGQKKALGTAPLASAQVLVDGDDEVRFAIGYNAQGRLASSWRPRDASDWVAFELPGFVDESVKPHALTPDGTGVLFTGVSEEEPRSGLFRLDLTTGAVELVYRHDSVDIHDMIWDDPRKTIVGVRLYADRPIYHWLTPQHPKARLHVALQKAFPRHAIEITSSTDDGSRAVVYAWSDVDPGEYFLVDTKAMRADSLRAARAWIDPLRMRPKEPFEMTARDGLRLHGYVTRPDGEGPHPLVVLPHGGPHGVRDNWFFDSEVQLLASRGYAVLQVNFRGSAGYGASFTKAGHREWGGKIQDDIADATRWAVGRGIGDARRICIFGSSFGAYSAMMSAVREPSLYRCAIGLAGVYDLELMHASADIPRSKRGRSYLEDAIGRDLDRLRAHSPARHAERITAPVLLIHGTEDWRTDFEHAKRMKQALDKAGKPYEWMPLKGEGHGVFDERTREDVYTRVLGFLERHLAN